MLLSLGRCRCELHVVSFAPSGRERRMLWRRVNSGWRLVRLWAMSSVSATRRVDCFCDLGLRNSKSVLEPLVVLLNIGVTVATMVARVTVAWRRCGVQLCEVQFLILLIFLHLVQ